jgi:hypothetical protein
MEKRIFVDGFVCLCGKIWPVMGPFYPLPAPNPCPLCGTYQKDMSHEAIIKIMWQTGRFFKTEHVRYERNPNQRLNMDGAKSRAAPF